jgi:hypothetical protein
MVPVTRSGGIAPAYLPKLRRSEAIDVLVACGLARPVNAPLYRYLSGLAYP